MLTDEQVEVFKKLYYHYLEGEEWLNKIPMEVSETFFDTPYINSIEFANDLLFKSYFRGYEESLSWFIHDWTNDNSLTATLNGVEYSFKDIDEYIEYLKLEGTQCSVCEMTEGLHKMDCQIGRSRYE